MVGCRFEQFEIQGNREQVQYEKAGKTANQAARDQIILKEPDFGPEDQTEH
jgi:hypothetical protein